MPWKIISGVSTKLEIWKFSHETCLVSKESPVSNFDKVPTTSRSFLVKVLNSFTLMGKLPE